MERSVYYYVLLLVFGHFLCSGKFPFIFLWLCVLLHFCSFSSLISILLWIYTYIYRQVASGLRLCFSMLSLYVSHFLLFLELLPFVFFILFFWHIIICFSLLVIDSLDHQDMFLNSVTPRCIFLHLSLASQLLYYFFPLLLLFKLNKYTCWTSWVQLSYPNLFVPPSCSLCCTIVYQLSTSFYPLIFIKVVVAMIV